MPWVELCAGKNCVQVKPHTFALCSSVPRKFSTKMFIILILNYVLTFLGLAYERTGVLVTNINIKRSTKI